MANDGAKMAVSSDVFEPTLIEFYKEKDEQSGFLRGVVGFCAYKVLKKEEG